MDEPHPWKVSLASPYKLGEEGRRKIAGKLIKLYYSKDLNPSCSLSRYKPRLLAEAMIAPGISCCLPQFLNRVQGFLENLA